MYYLYIADIILEGEIIEDNGTWCKLKEKNYNYSNMIDKWTPIKKELIKKQSENVFDLIERENDLLKIGVLGYPNIMEAKSINGSFQDMKNILAIYKPNLKGDYIKVWESE